MPTIIDVAKEAGVSFKTVSRVINGESGVREETKMRVLNAVEALQYEVNSSARRLRAKSPRNICLLSDNPSRSYAADLQIGAMEGCQDVGFNLIVQRNASEEALDLLLSRSDLAGIIVGAPQSEEKRVIARLKEADIPMIRVATRRDLLDTHFISVDERKAAFDATNHLIQSGHRKIAVINGPKDRPTPRLRYEGFCEALEKAGLTVEDKWAEWGDFDFESGLAISERYLDSDDRPTSIFAANDDMAAGALAAAYRLGIRVPDELSIVGFDDSAIAPVVYPSLTTIHQPTGEMGRQAVMLLDRMRRCQEITSTSHLVDHSLVVRNSTNS